jgi:hypothetical protein
MPAPLWRACEGCGKERWTHGQKLCRACKQKTPEMRERRRVLGTGRKHTEASKQKIREWHTGKFGKDNRSWKGGRYEEHGYVFVKLTPTDPCYPMTKHDGYVLEHRLFVAQSLGRCLQPGEIVHHKNHIRNDNRIENLQLVALDRHRQITILEEKIKDLEAQLEEGAKLLRLLQ